MEPDAAVEASQAGPSLLDVMASAGEWAVALIALLDPPTRSTLSQTSTGLHQWVWEASPQATATLLAYGGLSDAAWQRRLASAEHGLILRGPHRSNKLVLRIPTPNPAALLSIHSMSAAAGRAVTELEVQQRRSSAEPHEGVRTPWLQALPAAFPNLRILRINRLHGCLPPPAQLPHLRELHVTIVDQTLTRDPACTPDQICTSVAPYLAQITTLSLCGEVSFGGMPMPWAKAFSKVTHTLTHFKMRGAVDQQLMQLLSTRAPALVRLTCYELEADGVHVWAIRELGTETELNLQELPASPQGVTFLPDYGGKIRCRLYVTGPQGLPERVRDRVTQWHFACPCDLSMYVPDAENMSSDDIQTGIETAVRQIAPCLPRGSRVYALPHHDVLYRQDARANAAGAAAVATVAPAVPHVKLMPGPMPGTDEGMGMLLQETPPAQEVRIDRLDLTGAHAECDIRMGGFYVDPLTEWTTEMTTKMDTRLQHWTFLIKGHTGIYILRPRDIPPAEQPVALRRILRHQGSFRWRAEQGWGKPILHVQIDEWSVSSELVVELRRLPSGPFACSMSFQRCDWTHATPDTLQQLLGAIPTSYTDVSLVAMGIQDRMPALLDICKGVTARGKESERLRLCVHADWGRPFTDMERTQIEACIDEQDLGRYITVDFY